MIWGTILPRLRSRVRASFPAPDFHSWHRVLDAVGSQTATVLVSSIDDSHVCNSGRSKAPCLGIMPSTVVERRPRLSQGIEASASKCHQDPRRRTHERPDI